MIPLADILDTAARSLGGFLPRLGGAIVLLVLGLLAARVIAGLVRRALTAADLDALAERWHIHDVLGRVGIDRSLTRLVARLLRITLSLVVIFAALSLLGLQFLSDSLNQAVLFLPKLLIAAALVLAGVVVAGVVRERVDRAAYQMDFPLPLGQLVEVAVIAIFVLSAASQVAISTAILSLLIAILLAAAAATLAIAFGLGGREMARAVSAGRYVRGAYRVGQTITVGDLRGRIEAVESAATVLETADGRTIRVPNHLMLEEVVTVHDEAGSAAGGGSP